jgi:hypothetical protein
MRKAVVILVALFVVSCGGSPKQIRATGGEGTVFDLSTRILENGRDTTISIGKMSAGEVIRYDAWLRNVDTIPLVITEVDTSCGCTSVEYDKQPIQPNQKAHFSFQFDSRGQMSGRQVKYIDIHTSASKNRYTIIISAEVSRE